MPPGTGRGRSTSGSSEADPRRPPPSAILATASGCGGIGRRAAFRSPWGQPRGGSSPLIRTGTFQRRDIARRAAEQQAEEAPVARLFCVVAVLWRALAAERKRRVRVSLAGARHRDRAVAELAGGQRSTAAMFV